jgi:hypothetical protein
MEALPWVKCPPKTSTRETSLNMEKPALTSHKSHMSFARHLPARSATDMCGWLATSPARTGAGTHCGAGAHHEGAGRGELGMAAGQRPDEACRVVSSARPEAVSWRRSGVTAPTARVPAAARTVESAPGLDALDGANDDANDGARDLRERQTRLTRGSEDSCFRNGERESGQSAMSVVQFHGFRKGQGAYLGPAGAGIRDASLVPRLSRCETLANAQDLQTATMGDVSYV